MLFLKGEIKMKKYTLQRLESLAVVASLAVSLTACNGSKEGKNDELYESYIAISNAKKETDARISDYELENERLSDEIEQLEEELNRKEAEIESLTEKAESYASLISKEKAYALLDKSELYDKKTKEFIKCYLSDKSDYVVMSLLLQTITGDSSHLAGNINGDNEHVPLTPIYDSNELFILDNSKATTGMINDYDALYVNMRYSNTYGNYNVYETPFGVIIADSNNRVVAYTTQYGLISVYDLNISIVSFNRFLENIGLPSYIASEYLPEDLERAKLAVNKKIAGYQEDGKTKMSNVLVMDMTSCKNYYHTEGYAPYYFLDYIGPNVFNTSEFLYQDIFNSDGYFTLDRESGEFLYQYPDYYSYNRSFYLTEYDFFESPLKPLSDLLNEKNMPESISHKAFINTSELADIYSALKPEEPAR